MQQASVIAQGLIELERNGESHLGVDTGIPANSPSLRKLAGQRRQVGWIIRDGEITEWTPKGFVEHGGRVHVYGPMFRGRSFDELLSDWAEEDPREGVSSRLEIIARIGETFARLRDERLPTLPFHTRSLILAVDGSVLVLPPDILDAIRDHQDYADRIARMERFTHPDRSNEANQSFALATLAYYAITGEFPYGGTDEEELHARVRAATPAPAAIVDVEIRPEVSDAIHKQLTLPKEAEPTQPAEWAATVRRWMEEGVRREIAAEDREKALAEARQTRERLERGFRRKEAVRRNGRTDVIIAAIVIIVGSIPATIIRNALAPRATAGLPPAEVVTTFYTSINSLDHMTMEDAVIDDAAAELVREVTNLFVLDRQRMSVEMESGFVDASAWREAGMPTLGNARAPYGVHDLQLETVPAPEGEAAFRVTYERWLPDYELAEQTGRAGILGLRNVDLVRLRMDREDWVIYERIPQQSEEIDLAALREQAS